jgi:hypothetical protein
MRPPLNQQQAFLEASGALGPARELAREFRKAPRRRSLAELLMIGVCAMLVAGVLFLGGLATILCYNATWDRICAASAMLGTVALSLKWRWLVPWVPAIRRDGKRILVIIAAMAGSFGFASFYCQVIVPQLATPYDGMLPAVGVFTLIPVAIGFCFILAFEEAARRRTQDTA